VARVERAVTFTGFGLRRGFFGAAFLAAFTGARFFPTAAFVFPRRLFFAGLMQASRARR
jgi:hypothetical protein